MKDFICDICHRCVDQYHLTELISGYQTQDVKEVCPSCLGKLEKYSAKLVSVFARFKTMRIKQMIKKMQRGKE